MFTTGNHIYLYMPVVLYFLAAILYFVEKRNTGFAIVIGGFVIHTLYLTGRGWLGTVFIPNPIVEGPFLLPWCLVLILILYRLSDKNTDWGDIFIPILAFSLFSVIYAKGMIPPTPKKITIWATLFFLTEVMGHALFYAGAALACNGKIRNNQGEAFHSFIVWGFILYSVAQVTGAVWCYLGWGNTFRWGPRHMGSAGIWLLYAMYLHLRYVRFWDTGRRAWFVILAAVMTVAISFSSYIREMNFPRVGG